MSAQVAYTDEELIQRISRDDEQAFRLLYERYWDKMLAHAYWKLGSGGEAEEIVQDAFVGLWRRRASLQLKHSFYTYISAVVKYEILRRLASRKAKTEFEKKAVHLYREEDNSTLQWLNYEDLREQIELTIQSLPEKCRLVFRLSRQEGLTERQIAETLQISPKTVEAHKARALRTLRTTLAQFLGSFL
ncbi:MAG TPA: RNA polymerase sigma-70 factor [Puia sp.]